MSPILNELFRAFAKELAVEVAKVLATTTAKPEKAKKEKKADTPAPMRIEVSNITDPETLREECLTLINRFAPTHGKQIRAALALFDAKRLSEVPAEALPQLLAELAGFNDD